MTFNDEIFIYTFIFQKCEIKNLGKIKAGLHNKMQIGFFADAGYLPDLVSSSEFLFNTL